MRLKAFQYLLNVSRWRFNPSTGKTTSNRPLKLNTLVDSQKSNRSRNNSLERIGERVAMLCCAAGLLCSPLFSACTNEEETSQETTKNVPGTIDWACYDYGAECICHGLDIESNPSSSSYRANLCLSFSCCMVFPDDMGQWRCECANLGVSCEEEASQKDSASVVPICPPNVDNTSAQDCATLQEKCNDEYLKGNHLAGCCDGLTCRENSQGVLICQ